MILAPAGSTWVLLLFVTSFLIFEPFNLKIRMNFCQRWRLVGFEQDTPAKDERWRVLSKGPGAALTTKHYKGICAILNSA